MNQRLLDKFIRYAKIDTKSDPNSQSCPSTKKQFNLAKLLQGELKELGMRDIRLDEHCYLYAELPANSADKYPVIGLIAHMDTAPDLSGENVNPQIIDNYDGKEINLGNKGKFTMSPKDFPEMKEYIGKTLITTDGETLLGADDKAGIAEIMEALHYLKEHPEFKHGTIKIGFTPDEEIGRGADRFDVKSFGADYAYTIDGSKLGEIEFENFNAAHAKIKIQGRNVHPGSAKNKMINSIHLAEKLNSLLPYEERPEYTENYEGFFHLIKFNGTVEETTMEYIIRDHDKIKFEARKAKIRNIIEFLNKQNGKELISLEHKDQYFNMREKIEPVMHIIELAKKAVSSVGIEPEIIPIRGGTDGARLSYMGLPCPNIFTGAHNGHGRYEFVVLESMEKAVECILNILKFSKI
ncbi:MAG TPA: peptidase T [Lentisphaeria bacterium]|nr:MAG: peptidase T [Lentisphaerae bacterium GWF2_38_69]HBM14964.1 peptidase T [Lentisphaeria bacterium]